MIAAMSLTRWFLAVADDGRTGALDHDAGLSVARCIGNTVGVKGAIFLDYRIPFRE